MSLEAALAAAGAREAARVQELEAETARLEAENQAWPAGFRAVCGLRPH